jgi:putative ABC transport system substrate-binding protein
MLRLVEVFKHRLGELGWVEGRNIAFEYRWADGNDDRLPTLAAELIRLKVDIIVATNPTSGRAAQELTRMIPIVVWALGNPVGGLVKSPGQPGENLTGSSFMGPELGGKRLELLKELIPRVSRVAVLGNIRSVEGEKKQIKEIDSVARSLRLQLQIVNVNTADEIANAFSEIRRGNAGAITLLTQGMFVQNRTRIVELAAKCRLPAMYPRNDFVRVGGLVSYGPDRREEERRAAYFVDRILKGAKPSDLPIEQPMKLELVINLKTANALGLTIPPKVLMWADKVIE